MLLSEIVLTVLQAAGTWQAWECQDSEAQKHLEMGLGEMKFILYFSQG